MTLPGTSIQEWLYAREPKITIQRITVQIETAQSDNVDSCESWCLPTIAHRWRDISKTSKGQYINSHMHQSHTVHVHLNLKKTDVTTEQCMVRTTGAQDNVLKDDSPLRQVA